MKTIVMLVVGTMVAFATLEARATDPDKVSSTAGNVAVIGEELAVDSGDIGPSTHLEPRNINISSEDWNSIRDSVLLRVQGRNANAASNQAFAVVACDRASFDDVAHISLMRVGAPREVVTSTNDSAASQIVGNIARTVARQRLEGQSEILYAVLTAPFLNGVIDAGWQIGSGGYRTLAVLVLDTFNADGSAPAIAFNTGCGQTLFPF